MEKRQITQIDSEYRAVHLDKFCTQLQRIEQVVTKDKNTKKPTGETRDEWSHVAYCHDLYGALRAYCKKALEPSTDVLEVLRRVEHVENTVKEYIK